MTADHFEYLAQHVNARHDAVNEIGAVRWTHKNGRVFEAKLLYDVGPDAWRGGGGKRVYAGVGKPFLQRCQSSILGTEVVSPMTDAVGLVNHKRPHAAAGQ